MAAAISTARQSIVSFLLVLLFVQMFSFMGFIQFAGLFTLSRIGANAESFMIIATSAFVFITFIQAGLVGWLSERFGERSQIIVGLCLLGGGLIQTSATPSISVPWYSKAELEAERYSDEVFVGELLDLYQELKFDLPKESNTGWLSLS